MPFKNEHGVKRYVRPRKNYKVQLPRNGDKLILMICLFGEDITRVIMRHLSTICKQETVVYRELITEQFKGEFERPWLRIMRSISPYSNPYSDIDPIQEYTHEYIQDRYYEEMLYETLSRYFITKKMSITDLTADVTKKVATANDYPLRKYDVKKPPIMDKQSKKIRSSYLKRESRRQMKMSMKR